MYSYPTPPTRPPPSTFQLPPIPPPTPIRSTPPILVPLFLYLHLSLHPSTSSNPSESLLPFHTQPPPIPPLPPPPIPLPTPPTPPTPPPNFTTPTPPPLQFFNPSLIVNQCALFLVYPPDQNGVPTRRLPVGCLPCMSELLSHWT